MTAGGEGAETEFRRWKQPAIDEYEASLGKMVEPVVPLMLQVSARDVELMRRTRKLDGVPQLPPLPDSLVPSPLQPANDPPPMELADNVEDSGNVEDELGIAGIEPESSEGAAVPLPGALEPPPTTVVQDVNSPEESVGLDEEDFDLERQPQQQSQRKPRSRRRIKEEEEEEEDEVEENEKDSNEGFEAPQEVNRFGLILVYVLVATCCKVVLIVGALLFVIPHTDVYKRKSGG
eukprot:TRINITY_DN16629_c1_g1_i1.p1 TRINITY_DN16629_c1_g1~~TRINITY_DN16629_c1_g1_i1.p1  ORF type:complete len:234 (-),score=50.54 TRINITY_DN16629_c1_g1_i1:94-795(-)